MSRPLDRIRVDSLRFLPVPRMHKVDSGQPGHHLGAVPMSGPDGRDVH